MNTPCWTKVKQVPFVLIAFTLAVAFALAAQSLAQPAPSRGALLYQTHCIACHGTQVHWRDQKLATDWASLSAQVRRWQANTGLQWSDQDIDEVARYLNSTIYRYPDSGPRPIG